MIGLDEIDKAGRSARNGDPLATLLTMIERSSAAAHFDKCLMAPVDLSHVSWIMTANSADRLPAPLRSRLTVIEVAGLTLAQFDQLVVGLVRTLAAELQLHPAMLPTLAPELVDFLRARFARHRSVRRTAAELEVAVAAMIRMEPRRPH